MNKWNDGNLNDLVLEGRIVQQCFIGKSYQGVHDSDQRKSYSFAKLVKQGLLWIYFLVYARERSLV